MAVFTLWSGTPIRNALKQIPGVSQAWNVVKNQPLSPLAAFSPTLSQANQFVRGAPVSKAQAPPPPQRQWSDAADQAKLNAWEAANKAASQLGVGNNTNGTTNTQGNQGNTGGGSNQDFSNLIETPPPQPSFENLYGSVFDVALSNIESQIGTTEQETVRQMELAKQVQQGRDLGVNQRLTSQQGQFDINKQELTGAENQTENQLRQQVAEMNQGIQSRYGGTTGTGRFASEILGRSFVQEMSANRQNLTNKISIIEQNRNDAISQANKQIFESQLQTQQDISQLTAQKNNAITELRNQQGLLGIQRSKMIVDAVNNYNSQIEGVRQRNSKFYQDLYLKQVDFDNKVKESQLTAYKDYTKQQADFNDRVTKIFLGGGISDEAIPSVERQLGLPKGQLQQPKKKDQYSNDSLAGLNF